MTKQSGLNFDNIMLTSIESEDFLDNEEKPSLTSSWSSESDKEPNWKSSDSSVSSPLKTPSFVACSTPMKKNIDESKFVTCLETNEKTNLRSLSGADIIDITKESVESPSHIRSCPYPKSKRSLSLHDLDNISEFPSNKLAENAISCEVSHSGASSKTRSKDSGIHRTASCISLLSNNTYSRKYDHIQSKVKQYIQNMKEQDSRCRQQKSASKPSVSYHNNSRVSEPIELTEERFNELKNEILEKDLLISTYHEKYINLQIKYADIKNKYDALRFNAGFKDRTSSLETLFCSADESIKPEGGKFDKSNLENQNSISSEFCNSFIKPLKPVTSVYSTSANLKWKFSPLPTVSNNKVTDLNSCSTDNEKLDNHSLMKSDSKYVDPFVKVKRWQESLSSPKSKTEETNKNSDTDNFNGEIKYANSSSPCRINSSLSSKYLSESPSLTDQYNSVFLRNFSSHSNRKNRIIEKNKKIYSKSFAQIENVLTFNRNSLPDDPQARSVSMIENEIISNQNPSHENTSNYERFNGIKVQSSNSNSNSCDRINLQKFLQKENIDSSSKKSVKPRKKTKKSKQSVENVFDFHSHTNFDRIVSEKREKMFVISSNNRMFKPFSYASSMCQNTNNLETNQNSSINEKNNLLLRESNFSQKFCSPRSRVKIIANPTSSQELVPTVLQSNPDLSSAIINFSNGDKESKSALCCCLEASDMYINQLNEGLDKLMVALTELGTSKVLKI